MRELVLSILFALFSANATIAQEFTIPPTQHPNATLLGLLEADREAFVEAKTAYDNLVTTKAAYTAAEAALNQAISTGQAATSPAENLGELAQSAINARSARDDAQSAYDVAMVTLQAARNAYNTAVGTPLSVEMQTLEDDLMKTNDFVAGEKARVDVLEAQLLALKAAVCHGHDYAHDHAAAYTAICAKDDQTKGTEVDEVTLE